MSGTCIAVVSSCLPQSVPVHTSAVTFSAGQMSQAFSAVIACCQAHFSKSLYFGPLQGAPLQQLCYGGGRRQTSNTDS